MSGLEKTIAWEQNVGMTQHNRKEKHQTLIVHLVAAWGQPEVCAFFSLNSMQAYPIFEALNHVKICVTLHGALQLNA